MRDQEGGQGEGRGPTESACCASGPSIDRCCTQPGQLTGRQSALSVEGGATLVACFACVEGRTADKAGLLGRMHACCVLLSAKLQQNGCSRACEGV